MTQLMTTPIETQVRARFYRSLADPSRLAILDALRDGERRVSEVASIAGLNLSNASRHLACLKDCGLVEARQDWRNVYYSLADGVAAFLITNDAFLEQIAERVAACERAEMAGRV